MTLINNSEWLAGWKAFHSGAGCPWGNESGRLGWIAAKAGIR